MKSQRDARNAYRAAERRLSRCMANGDCFRAQLELESSSRRFDEWMQLIRDKFGLEEAEENT